MTVLTTGTSFSNDAGNGYAIADGFSGPAGAAASFPNGTTGTGPATFTQANFTGSTSGTTILEATATASGTLTLPAATDQLVGRATTDTLTNKTLTAPALTGGTFAQTSGANLLVEDVYRCTTAQTANTNVVPAGITGLSGAVVVGTYAFEASIFCTVASGTAGIAINQVLTTAVLGVCNFQAAAFLAASIATQTTTTATSGTALFTAADQPVMILIKGSFTVTTGGTFGLQMCQNTSDASNSVVNIGSTMRLTRIA